MSTIDIAGVCAPRYAAPRRTAPRRVVRQSAAVRPQAPATRLRLTVRGRRVLAAAVSVPAVVAVSLAIISGGGAVASDKVPPAVAFESVSVQPGDSLWSIAETIAPEADPRDVVDAIMRLNGMTSSALDVGQSLSLPHEFAPAPEGARQ